MVASSSAYAQPIPRCRVRLVRVIIIDRLLQKHCTVRYRIRFLSDIEFPEFKASSFALYVGSFHPLDGDWCADACAEERKSQSPQPRVGRGEFGAAVITV